MSFSKAKEVLSNNGIKEYENALDVELPENIEVAYFPIEEHVDLVITRKKGEEKNFRQESH